MDLILRHNDVELHRSPVRDLPASLHVGRSSKNEWSVPKTCTRVSSVHARIDIRKNHVRVSDNNSSNGIRIAGRKVKSTKVEAGTNVRIGDCVLLIENTATKAKILNKDPSLLQLGGAHRDKRHFVTQASTRLGSDGATDDIVFQNQLVSRGHAVILRKDNACWLMDKESANGTSVNGEELPSGIERMLRHGDIVSVAHIDLRFHDGVQSDQNANPLVKFLVMGATAILLSAGWFAYQHAFKDSAPETMVKAEELGRAGDLDGAMTKLKEVPHAADARNNKQEHAALKKNIAAWQNAQRGWERAQTELSSTNFQAAAQSLSVLANTPASDWSWNAEAHAAHSQMLQAKGMIDHYLASQSALARSEIDLDELRAHLNELPPIEPSNNAAFGPIEEALGGVDGQLRQIEVAFAKIDEILALCAIQVRPDGELVYPDFHRAVKETKAFRRGASPAVRSEIDLLMPVLTQFSEAFDNTLQISTYIKALQFEQALAVPLQLPPQAACSQDPRLSDTRAAMEKIHAALIRQAHNLRYHITRIEQAIPEGQELPSILEIWAQREPMQKVRACDCHEQDFPRRNRTVAISVYDEMLGIEGFHYMLKSLPGNPDFTSGNTANFKPQLVQTRHVLELVADLVAYAETQQDSLHQGHMLALLGECDALLARRNQLQTNLISQIAHAPLREQIILGGIVLGLASGKQNLEVNGEPLKVWLAARYKESNQRLLDLNQEYRRALPSQKISLRNRILQEAVPGQFPARAHWVNRLEGKSL